MYEILIYTEWSSLCLLSPDHIHSYVFHKRLDNRHWNFGIDAPVVILVGDGRHDCTQRTHVLHSLQDASLILRT
jgi:hypothetical protein